MEAISFDNGSLFFQIPKASVLENYQFLLLFFSLIGQYFEVFSVPRQRRFKFVCVFDVLWILICACCLYETRTRQYCGGRGQCLGKKVLLAKHGSDIISNHRFVLYHRCVVGQPTNSEKNVDKHRLVE